ncbi:uncharacterized protein LOC125474671 [Pyrus x bretschneideri]|uniref:uncharacterized protein LOC125474671 n=1 Tax=Pyrus x bretschneideri TaxID=225117 RepID=UPI00202EE1D4|nr:uncharacterized protein LOC125474671 [Pyrus x bretschneideri]
MNSALLLWDFSVVLSRNPIHDVGDSLKKMKSVTKLNLAKPLKFSGFQLSLSHCQLQTIEASLKFCIELKELRLAHSDIKVINSLVNLRNLNLQGNTVVEKDKLEKKIKKMLPNLHVYNARPIDKYINNEKGAGVDEVDYSSLNTASKRETQIEEPKYRDFKHRAMGETNGDIENASHSDTNKSKWKRQGSKDNASNNVVVEGDEKRDPVKKKNRKHQMQNEDDMEILRILGILRKHRNRRQYQDTPFLELFSVDAEVAGEEKAKDKEIELGGLVTFPLCLEPMKFCVELVSRLYPFSTVFIFEMQMYWLCVKSSFRKLASNQQRV